MPSLCSGVYLDVLMLCPTLQVTLTLSTFARRQLKAGLHRSTLGRFRVCSPRKIDNPLDQNPLDARNSGAGSLIQADGIIGAIVQLGRARRLVIRNLLRMLNCTTILQVGRDARRTEGVAASRAWQSSPPNAPFDHGKYF